jgi:hypothetical protein
MMGGRKDGEKETQATWLANNAKQEIREKKSRPRTA